MGRQGKGNSSIAQRIPLTVNIVAEGATLTAEVVESKGLTGTTVYGTLENNGAAEKVTVKESGLLNNNDAVTKLYNYGKVYNNPAETSAPEDQAEIFYLYNYGIVYNYGRIETVQDNNNANADNENNTAKIVLMNNENIVDGDVIGAIFNIEDIASGVKKVENNIEYTVEKSNAVKAGAHAMFMPCGLGHMMGLDVHDMENLGEVYVGYNGQPKSTQFGRKSLRLGRELEPGFVLTIEPGIYFIPELIDLWRSEHKFTEFLNYDKLETYKDFSGIRNEEDYLITEDGARLLGKKIPLHAEDVEKEHC